MSIHWDRIGGTLSWKHNGTTLMSLSQAGLLTATSFKIGTATVPAGAVVLADDEAVTLGTSADVLIEWDTAGTDSLRFLPAADDTIISFGVSAATQLSCDLLWIGNEANAANYLYFDASADLVYTTGIDLQFKDNDFLVFGTGAGATGDVTMVWDATDLKMVATGAAEAFRIGGASHVLNTTIRGTLTVGVDDTGNDVTFFGATTACKMVWDESEDQLVITGPADVPALKIAGAGSKSAAAYAAAGTAWNDGGTPALCADQMYWIVDIGGTLYRIPLWANA
jgi:hypothetical protein